VRDAAGASTAGAAPVEPLREPPVTEGRKEDAAQLLQRVLGTSPSTTPSHAQQKVQALIADALAGTASAAPANHEDRGRAERTAALRAVLNDAEFRALERAWRSVHWLVTRLDEDQLELHIADAPKAALAALAAQSGGRLEATPLHALLANGAAGEPWDAVVTDYTFTLAHDDLMLLATLGALAARVPAPALVHADLSLCGCASPAAVEAPWDWRIGDDDVGQLHREIRRHPAAKHLVLAAPRFLLRQPYGKRTDPIESFEFEELAPRPSLAAFSWTSPAFACAYWLAAQHAAGSEAFDTSIDDLPAPLFDDGAGDAIQPPLEVLLTERARATAAQHGVVTLVGGRNTNRIATDGLFAWANERQENA
jgi:type VI secretion system protein ImpC